MSNCLIISPPSYGLCWKGSFIATLTSDWAAEEEGNRTNAIFTTKFFEAELFSLIFLLFDIIRADEVKEHPFFHGVDWQQVYLQKYPPPLIPPRGEVNAADAFDIGSFDEEDTKGYKV